MPFDATVDEVLTSLCARHPIGYTPEVVWRGYRVSAGIAYYRRGVIGLSKFVIKDEQAARATLVHEYAHLLAYTRHGQRGVGHGEAWRQAMRDLGAEPRVCHCYEVQRNARKQEVGYQCQRCGTVLVRHRRLPKRRRYVHLGCGGAIKYAWTRPVIPSPQPT